MITLNDLHDDIITSIMLNMTTLGLRSCCVTNKRINIICKQEKFWYYKFNRDFPKNKRSLVTWYDSYIYAYEHKGSTWTIGKAKNVPHGYIIYAENGEIPRCEYTSRIKHKLKTGSDILINFEYKIIGTQEQIITAFGNVGYKPSTIDYVITTSINKDNYLIDPHKSKLEIIINREMLSIRENGRMEKYDINPRVFKGTISVIPKPKIDYYHSLNFEGRSYVKEFTSEYISILKQYGLFLNVNSNTVIMLFDKSLPCQFNFFYNNNYRIAGSILNIIDFLREYGYHDDIIQTIMDNSITYYNYLKEPYKTMVKTETMMRYPEFII